MFKIQSAVVVAKRTYKGRLLGDIILLKASLLHGGLGKQS